MPEIGISMLRVLERLGHSVTYSPEQTCCGRLAFDSGKIDEARDRARRQLALFADASAIVTPSPACAAMMRHEYAGLLAGSGDPHEIAQITGRIHEFSHLLVEVLGVDDVGARYAETVAIQECCNTRRSGARPDSMRRLLSRVRGLRIVEEPRQDCCGFGGPFALAFPELSASMGGLRADSFVRASASCFVSNDPGCLLQMRGILGRRAKPIRGVHIAEVLATV